MHDHNNYEMEKHVINIKSIELIKNFKLMMSAILEKMFGMWAL